MSFLPDLVECTFVAEKHNAMKKQFNYRLIKSLRVGIIHAETWYSVDQAAFYLGVHRMTIYKYFRRTTRALAFSMSDNGFHHLIQGKTLMEYKAAGLPKVGRRRKTGK